MNDVTKGTVMVEMVAAFIFGLSLIVLAGTGVMSELKFLPESIRTFTKKFWWMFCLMGLFIMFTVNHTWATVTLIIVLGTAALVFGLGYSIFVGLLASGGKASKSSYWMLITIAVIGGASVLGGIIWGITLFMGNS